MSSKMRICLLVHLNNGVEQIGNTLAAATDSRHDRHTQKITQLLDIQFITLRSELIIHIQSHHHPEVHIDKLSSQVEISLKVGSVDHIHNDIRHVVDQIATHIKLLRTICRQRISARKVDNDKAIAAIFERSLLCIDSHAAVVTHMLMTAGSHIEKRCLAAVRITHQGHLDDLSSLLGQCGHLPLDPILPRLKRRQRLERRAHKLCLALTDHLDLVRLVTTERNLISDDLILDGILQRGIKDNLHLIALDKAHLDDAFTETAVTVNFHDHATLTRI